MTDVDDNNVDPQIQTRGFWASIPRHLFLISLAAAAVGNTLVFAYPVTNGLEVSVGFFVAMAGFALIFYIMFLGVWHSRAHYYGIRQQNYAIYRKSIIPTLFGGISYLLLTILQPAIVAIPRALKSSIVGFTVPSVLSIFLAGCFISLCVSYYSLRYSDKIAAYSVTLRSMIYSFFALFIISVLATLYHLDQGLGYFMLQVAVNIPRFLVLGLIVGLTNKRSEDNFPDRPTVSVGNRVQ